MKSITHKCNICELPMKKDRGECEHCGWVQQTEFDRPDEIHDSYNFVSFNKAKQLYKEGKQIKPDFDDFLKCMSVYNELEFYYNDKHYGVLTSSDNIIHFYEWNVMEKGYQIYRSIDDFAKAANVEGVLLKDIWSAVIKVGTAS